MRVREKLLLILAVIFIGLGFLLAYESQRIGKLRLIFCDVGQGDGIFIVSVSGKEVLVDGGPGSKILECLSSSMAFWDRDIEMVVATHAQKDHMEGLLSVLERYEVATIVETGIFQDSNLYREWNKLRDLEGSRNFAAVAGDRFVIDEGLVMTVLWPPLNKTTQWQVNPPKDLNETSFVMRLDFGSVPDAGCVYFTGDIPKETLEGVIDKPCDILKIAHHGSKTGTSIAVLEKSMPKLAVVQSGKNSYGHPAREVLAMIESKGIEILRNDTDGRVELEIGNSGYKVFRNPKSPF